MSGINDEPCYYKNKHQDNNNYDHKKTNGCYNDDDTYCDDIVSSIEIIYLLASIFWIILVFALGIYQKADYMVWIIILLPLVVFAINYANLNSITYETEKQMFKGNFLSFGFIVAVILINWNSPLGSDGHNDKSEFFKLLITAFILMMISLVDIWVDEKHTVIVKHIKTSLHTMSLTLLAISLYLYYISHNDSENAYGFS